MFNTVCDNLQGFYDNPESIAESDLSSEQIVKHMVAHAQTCERCTTFFERPEMTKLTDMLHAIVEKDERTPVEDFPDEELRLPDPVNFSELTEAPKTPEDE